MGLQYPQPWIQQDFTASYFVWANPIGGVIIVDFAISPKTPIVKKGAQIVGAGPLRRLSDYMFLAYKQACQDADQDITKCLQQIKWVIRHSVTNALSIDVATLVTELVTNYKLWPGHPYHLDGEQGKALLGCRIPHMILFRKDANTTQAQ